MTEVISIYNKRFPTVGDGKTWTFLSDSAGSIDIGVIVTNLDLCLYCPILNFHTRTLLMKVNTFPFEQDLLG